MLEARCPLLDKGRHAFFLIIGGEERMKQSALEQYPFVRGVSYTRLIASLAIMTAGNECPAIVVAAASASSSKEAAGTMRDTRPARSASAASIVRAVRTRSIALALPTARGSRCVPPAPGMMPSLISGCPNLRAVRRNDEIAHHRQFAATSERVARDGGDDGLAHPAQRFPVARDVLGLEHVHVGPVLH